MAASAAASATTFGDISGDISGGTVRAEEVGAVRERIARAYQQLGSGQRKVADALLEAPLRFAGLPIDQLATQIGVGTSAISRFSRRLGYADTRALRLSLALELGPRMDEIEADDDEGAPSTSEQAIRRAARSAVLHDVEAIRTNLATVDSPAMAAAAQLVAAAPRIITVGYNSSGAIAERLAMMLRRRGWRARAENTPPDSSWTQDLDPDDLVIAVSHHGSAAGIVEALPGLRARGAHLLAITNRPERAIGREADRVLATCIAGGATPEQYEVDPVFPVQIVTIRALVSAAVAARALGTSATSSSKES
jgi:RpiR family transcriptional regulator, carbohydrate utilization regulator